MMCAYDYYYVVGTVPVLYLIISTEYRHICIQCLYACVVLRGVLFLVRGVLFLVAVVPQKEMVLGLGHIVVSYICIHIYVIISVCTLNFVSWCSGLLGG